MCTVSMVGDHYMKIWPKRYPWVEPTPPRQNQTFVLDYVPRAEFDALRREVEDMKALLARAKDYDERNGEPDCEIDEKMAFLRKAAELVGIDLDDVLKPSAG
jgi:hypothetical protein